MSHHVQISGLTPGTSYFYECGDDAAGFSPVLNFTTSVAVGSEFPVEILAWADSELALWAGEPDAARHNNRSLSAVGLVNSGPSWVDIMRVYPTAAFTWAPGKRRGGESGMPCRSSQRRA